MQTIDEIINEVFSDEQDQFLKVEADPVEKNFYDLTVEERLDMLPF